MKTGLVLEGGACRGVFTSGVLDVMMEQHLKFDYCIGVSAGAGNAMNLKSNQHGRAYELVAGDETPPYYGLGVTRSTGKLLDLDMMYQELSYGKRCPFDFSAYYENPMECEYVVTCCETGLPEYLSERVYQKRLLDITKASSSMPGICPPVALDGKHYLDGGISDAMPVYRALAQGCDRVVLVMTKPASNLHPTDYAKLRPLFAKLYRGQFPALYQTLMTRKPRYFAQLEEILELEKEGKVFLIRPEFCSIKTLEKDRSQMRNYYHHGRQIAEQRWDALLEYLK